MNGRDFVRGPIFSLAVVILPMQLWSAGWCAAEVAGKAEDLEVTSSLVREIQFMLLRLGMEPGPIDGVIGPQTTRAWRKFQQDTGLLQIDLVNGNKIPAAALTSLRSGASRVTFEGERKPVAPPTTPPPAAAVASAQQAAPAPDRLAACPLHAEDFKIGATQYTPEKYLQEGFDGSTARGFDAERPAQRGVTDCRKHPRVGAERSATAISRSGLLHLPTEGRAGNPEMKA